MDLGNQSRIYCGVFDFIVITNLNTREKQAEDKRIYPKSTQEDIANDQITLKEYVDPFTGSKNK